VKDVHKYFNPVAGMPSPSWGAFASTSILVQMRSDNPSIVTSTTLPTLGSAQFTLAGFDDFVEYTGLFDRYRFLGLQHTLVPLTPGGATVFGRFTSAIDLDDANVPATFAGVAVKQGSLESIGGTGHTHSYVPHIAPAVYGSGVFSSFSNVRSDSCWLDCASTNVAHYGLKYAFDPTPVAITYLLTTVALVQFDRPGI